MKHIVRKAFFDYEKEEKYLEKEKDIREYHYTS